MTYDYAIATLETLLLETLRSLYPDASLVEAKVSIPTDKAKADFVTNISFLLSKELHKAPIAIAQEIVDALLANTEEFSAEAVMPGFINFRINNAGVSSILKHITTEQSAFGRNALYEGQTWVVEHTSPNPNKAMHVGHLRNNLIGMTIGNVLDFSGAKVIRDWVDNDRGIAIAKAMWGYVAYKQKADEPVKENLLDNWFEAPQNWLLPTDVNIKADHFVGECYLLGATAFKEDEAVEAVVRQYALDWETGDKKVWALWELILGFAHTGIFQTLERIGNHWDYGWHEHEHYKQGKGLVDEGLEKGIFKRLDSGAILTQFPESYKIPDTIVLKSDNTSLYITQDLALTKLKKEKYNADKLLWVIGPEQTVAMKQVFAICEQLGIGALGDFIHVPYGLISISKDGVRKKMSSRGGETLFVDDLLDEVKETILEADRGYSDADADAIAVGATKFAILKPARNTDTAIDINQAVSLEGDSGVYVLYTMARIRALIAKNSEAVAVDAQYEYSEDEHAHALQLLYFPQIITSILSDFSTNTLVEYSLDIAHSFNSMYAKERFITDDVVETQKKIELANASLVVLETTLKLLGIQRIEEI